MRKSWSRQYRKGYIRCIAQALIYREELIRSESLHREYHMTSLSEIWGDDRIYLGECRCRDTDDDIVCITPECAKVWYKLISCFSYSSAEYLYNMSLPEEVSECTSVYSVSDDGDCFLWHIIEWIASIQILQYRHIFSCSQRVDSRGMVDSCILL